MNAADAKALRKLRAVIDPAGRRPELERVLKASYYSWNAEKRARMMKHVRRVIHSDPVALQQLLRARTPGMEDLASDILGRVDSHVRGKASRKPGESANPMHDMAMSMLRGAPLELIDQAATTAEAEIARQAEKEREIADIRATRAALALADAKNEARRAREERTA